MKEAYWGYWLIILGVFVVVVMLLIQNVTSNNTENTYSIKQISEAAMVDAVDYAYYREYGELRINKEKFIESFMRRFAEVASLTTTYTIRFAGIYEAPPKVSVEVTSKTKSYTIGTSSESFDITSRVNAILEQNDNTTPPTKADEACITGVNTDTDLANVVGVAMDATSLYKTTSMKDVITSIPVDGTKFTINGISSDDSKWNVKYNGECGWVYANKMAINLEDYVPEMDYNITNQTGSIYKSSELDIPNLTNKKLYTDSYIPLARYSFAKSLKIAAKAAKKDGYTIVVYDAYRPNKVTTYATEKLKRLYDTNTTVKQNIDKASNGSAWGQARFLASSVSNHNKACAVDVSIRGMEMPTEMHELSTSAIKYQAYSGANSNKFMPTLTDGAKKLDHYMREVAKLNDLKSEWWHYQDPKCSEYNYANFWSNV